MANAVFYAVVVLTWGSSWLTIKYQLGVVPPEVSVIYRFGLAAAILFAWVRVRGLSHRFAPRDHVFMALQGALMFCINYFLFYLASPRLTTGLIATIFSTAVVMNIVNQAIFLRRSVQPAVLLGAGCGIVGIVTVFWPQLTAFDLANAGSLGVVLSVIATYSFSLGNMVSARNQATGLPVLPSTAWSMAYGTLFLTAFAIVNGSVFTFDPRPLYVGALLFLSILSSVVAFACYLTLLGRIGPDRAGYATVLFPVVALGLSTLFEGYVWTEAALVGIGLILLGNVIVLIAPRRAAVQAGPA